MRIVPFTKTKPDTWESRPFDRWHYLIQKNNEGYTLYFNTMAVESGPRLFRLRQAAREHLSKAYLPVDQGVQ